MNEPDAQSLLRATLQLQQRSERAASEVPATIFLPWIVAGLIAAVVSLVTSTPAASFSDRSDTELPTLLFWLVAAPFAVLLDHRILASRPVQPKDEPRRPSTTGEVIVALAGGWLLGMPIVLFTFAGALGPALGAGVAAVAGSKLRARPLKLSALIALLSMIATSFFFHIHGQGGALANAVLVAVFFVAWIATRRPIAGSHLDLAQR